MEQMNIFGEGEVGEREMADKVFIKCADCKYYADHGGKVGHCNLGNYKSEHYGYMKGILLTPNFFCTEHGERK